MAQLWDITFRHESLPGGEWRPRIPPAIEVSQEIKTVTTAVAGATSPVIEIISAENYRIRMAGLVQTPPVDGIISREFPEAQFKRLVNLARAKTSIEVACTYLSFFGIRRIVLESVQWTLAPGQPHAFSYTIRAASDEAPELQILNF